MNNPEISDMFAVEAMKVLLGHRLRSPLNLSNANANFEMEDEAGIIAHQSFQMADAMMFAREQKTHIQPPHTR